MQAKNVALVGGFSSWKPLAMKRLSDKWQITIQVYPGKYQYYFLADGQQHPDPQMPLRKGNRSLLTVEPE